jgi:phosphatidylglycerophosphate synthase
MLDSHIRPIIDPTLNRIARFVARTGLTANALTVIGMLLACCAFVALATQSYSLAIAFILMNRAADGLDGPLARQTKATDLGGFLDIVSDFIFYSGVVFFFALGQSQDALAASFLIFSFMGAATSFLAYAIIAAKRGLNHEKQGKKSFFYAAGIAEGTETIIVLVMICIVPAYFTWIAYVYGGLCWLTALGRIRLAIRDFHN